MTDPDEEFLFLMKAPKHELVARILQLRSNNTETVEGLHKRIQVWKDKYETLRAQVVEGRKAFKGTIRRLQTENQQLREYNDYILEINKELQLGLQQARVNFQSPNPFGGGVIPTPSFFEPRYKDEG